MSDGAVRQPGGPSGREMIIAELTPIYVIVALLGLAIAMAAMRRNVTNAPVPARRVRSTLLIGALIFIL